MRKKTGAALSLEIALTMALGIVVLFLCLAAFNENVGELFASTNFKRIFDKEQVFGNNPNSDISKSEVSIRNAASQGSTLIKYYKELLEEVSGAIKELGGKGNLTSSENALLGALKEIAVSLNLIINNFDSWSKNQQNGNEEEPTLSDDDLTELSNKLEEQIKGFQEKYEEVMKDPNSSLGSSGGLGGLGGSLGRLETRVDPMLHYILNDTKGSEQLKLLVLFGTDDGESLQKNNYSEIKYLLEGALAPSTAVKPLTAFDNGIDENYKADINKGYAELVNSMLVLYNPSNFASKNGISEYEIELVLSELSDRNSSFMKLIERMKGNDEYAEFKVLSQAADYIKSGKPHSAKQLLDYVDMNTLTLTKKPLEVLETETKTVQMICSERYYWCEPHQRKYSTQGNIQSELLITPMCREAAQGEDVPLSRTKLCAENESDCGYAGYNLFGVGYDWHCNDICVETYSGGMKEITSGKVSYKNYDKNVALLSYQMLKIIADYRAIQSISGGGYRFKAPIQKAFNDNKGARDLKTDRGIVDTYKSILSADKSVPLTTAEVKTEISRFITTKLNMPESAEEKCQGGTLQNGVCVKN